MADQMISSDETSFVVGEQVLCYDPNPGNLLLLYKSKILKIRPEKDEQGRHSPGYLVRFQGWKSNRDRYVSAEYLLKDNDKNRTLQKTMAEEAGLMAYRDGNAYRKARKIIAKSNRKTIKSEADENLVHEEEATADRGTEPGPSGTSELPKRDLPANGNAYRKPQKKRAKSNRKPIKSEADENLVDEEEATADRGIEPGPSGTSELPKRDLPADGNAYRKAQRKRAKSNRKPIKSEADENLVHEEEATADRGTEPGPSGTSELPKRDLPANGNAYRKPQKKRAKSNRKPIKSEADENLVDEEEATADRGIEPGPSGTSELPKLDLPADGNVYRKAQRKRAKSNRKAIKSEVDENLVDEEEATADRGIEPGPSGTSELPKRDLPDLVFPEYLKIILGYSNGTVLRNDLIRLPGRPNVVTLLESFLMHSARINFNDIYIIKKHKAYAPKLIDKHEIERRFNLCVEVLDNLRIWFNTYLEVELLFNDNEKLQYNEAINMKLQQPVKNGNLQKIEELDNHTHENKDYVREKQDYLSNSNCTLEKMFKKKITFDKDIVSKADAWKAVPDSAYNEDIKEPAIVYGVYHFLRLLDVLPKILAQTNLQGEKLSTVYFYCNKLLYYIVRQSRHLFEIQLF